MSDRYALITSGGKTVISLQDRRIDTDAQMESIALAVGRLLSQCFLRIVIDFHNVETASIELVAGLSNIRHEIKKAGGTLRLCSMNAQVRALVESVPESHRFDFSESREDALAA